PEGAPRAQEIHVDLGVLAFGIATALGTSLLFGLAPVLHTRVDDLGAALKEGTRTAGSPRQRFRRGLVVSEVALAVVLVIGCGLVVEGFVKLRRVDVGSPPDGLLTGQVELTEKSYPNAAAMNAFWDRLMADVRALPGVSHATLLIDIPPNRRL